MSDPKPTLDDLRIERRPETRRKSRGGLVVGLIVLLLLIGAGIWWWKRPRAIEVQTVAAKQVQTSDGGGRTVLNASGYVTARRAATVASKISGKVVEVLLEEGMKVKEGQVIARLDDVNLRASLKLAEAQVESAKSALEEIRARLRQADIEWKRAINLVTNNIAAQADLDRAEAEAKALAARLEQQGKQVIVAEKELAVWQHQLDDTVIRAPFGGIVTTKDAQPGEVISPMSAGGSFTRTGIGTIVDMSSLEIEIDVNESFINRVQPGQPVEATLDAYPSWKIPCKVIAIIPTADRGKSTVKVRVGFDQLDPKILPQMAVKVAFRDSPGSSSQASPIVVVPKTAIQQQDGRDIVWVAKDGQAERRAITVSLTLGEEAQLSAGVSAGEKVVARPPADLTSGAKIKEIRP
jgi:RND family efflux transporter MFP subunit